MEHTTPYPHQRQQILARLLLTIWLPTICSPEATFATTSSAKAMASAADTSTGATGPSTPAMGSSEKIRLIAQGGHQVTVQKNNDKWQAEVEEHLATGFSSKLSLPVIIQEGMAWQQLATCSEALQRQRVVVDFAPDNGRVYIDSRGLWRGRQTLYEVIKQGALALVPEILEEGGIDIHTVDDQGWSALHWAVSKGYIETAALLLRHGANTELQDRQGKTPLDYADESGHRYLSDVVELLRLCPTLDNLIEDGVIQNQNKIKQQLYDVQTNIETLGTENIELYNYFQYRYHIQNASYRKALGEEKRATRQEKLAAEHQEPNVSLLSLDADLQKTMTASSVTSQDAGPLLNDQKDDKSSYKEQGDNKWRQFMEYCCAQQDPGHVLTRLGRENPDHLSPGQKDALKDALLAHEFYGSSSHAAAQAQHLRSEINLKAIMALRLSIIGYFLEATMYALSICSKLINSPSEIIVKDLRKARALLCRLQATQTACDGRPTTTVSATNTLHALRKWNARIGLPCNSINEKVYADIAKIHIKYAIAQDLQVIARELLLSSPHNPARSPACDGRPTTTSSPTNMFNTVKQLTYSIIKEGFWTLTEQKAYFDTTKIEIKCGIAQDLQNIAQELLPSSARNLARPQVPEEKILEIEQLAKCYQQAGVGTGIVGRLLLCILVGVGIYALFKFIRAYSKKSTPSPKRVWRSVFAAATTGILGLLALKYGRSLWNKGQELAACRGLNDVLAQALTYHDQGNMQQILNELCEPYATNKQLISLEEIKNPFSPKSPFPGNKLIAILAKFGFGPDNIAYLYNLMGEALFSEAKTYSYTIPDLIYEAENSFQCALDEELIQLAQDLGKKVTVSPIKRYFQKWKDFLLLRADARFLESIHHEDAPAISVEQRLKAVGHIAKMNLTLTKFTERLKVIKIDSKEVPAEKDDLAASIVEEAREAIEYYLQFYDMPPLRLAAINDYLKVISDHILAITKPGVNHERNALTRFIPSIIISY